MTDKTTQDFTRIADMGYPEGCHLWDHATTYANHRIWSRNMRKLRRDAFLLTAFVVACVAAVYAVGVV